MSGVWLTAPPGSEGDTHLDPCLFQLAVKRRLRMQVQESQTLCPLRGDPMDVFGDQTLVSLVCQ
eukprot:3103310-Amphidinium_carterae.1